ncbi:MAG: hypothetical protein ABJK39_12545 [Hyphomicrobiales bacterium]
MASILNRLKSARSTSISAMVLGLVAVGAIASTAAYGLTAKDGKPVTEENAPQAGEQKTPQQSSPSSAREGSMTLSGMRDIVKRLDEKAQEPRPGTFLMVVNDFEVLIVTAEGANRMRVMVRVRSAENLTKEELLRISQANLDAALDARYAIGRGVLWAVFIHPLSSLHPLQFIEAIGSTVNLAASYGTSYSSGQLLYGGGDSRGIIGRKLIDQLIKKGRPI